MYTLRNLFLALTLALAGATFAGCPKDTDTDTGTDVTAPQLDAQHPGWTHEDCLDCHTYDAHNDGKLPHECAECHGTNGAPHGHGGSTPCTDCHSGHSPAASFPDPESCQTCHI